MPHWRYIVTYFLIQEATSEYFYLALWSTSYFVCGIWFLTFLGRGIFLPNKGFPWYNKFKFWYQQNQLFNLVVTKDIIVDKRENFSFKQLGEIFLVEHNANPTKACTCQHTTYWFICRDLYLVLIWSIFNLGILVPYSRSAFRVSLISRGWSSVSQYRDRLVLGFHVFYSLNSAAQAEGAEHAQNFHEEDAHSSSHEINEMMLHEFC